LVFAACSNSSRYHQSIQFRHRTRCLRDRGHSSHDLLIEPVLAALLSCAIVCLSALFWTETKLSSQIFSEPVLTSTEHSWTESWERRWTKRIEQRNGCHPLMHNQLEWMKRHMKKCKRTRGEVAHWSIKEQQVLEHDFPPLLCNRSRSCIFFVWKHFSRFKNMTKNVDVTQSPLCFSLLRFLARHLPNVGPSRWLKCRRERRLIMADQSRRMQGMWFCTFRWIFVDLLSLTAGSHLDREEWDADGINRFLPGWTNKSQTNVGSW
jgi:hypothetical protein